MILTYKYITEMYKERLRYLLEKTHTQTPYQWK